MKTIARTLTGSAWKEIETATEAEAVCDAAKLGGMAACFRQDGARETGARYYALVDLLGRPSATVRVGGGRLPPGPGGREMTTAEGHMAYATSNADPFVLHGRAMETLSKAIGVEIPRGAHVPVPGHRTEKRLFGGGLVADPQAHSAEAGMETRAIDRLTDMGEVRRLLEERGLTHATFGVTETAREAEKTTIILNELRREREEDPGLARHLLGGRPDVEGFIALPASSEGNGRTMFDESTDGFAVAGLVQTSDGESRRAAIAGHIKDGYVTFKTIVMADGPDHASDGLTSSALAKVVHTMRTERLAYAAGVPFRDGIKFNVTRADLAHAMGDDNAGPPSDAAKLMAERPEAFSTPLFGPKAEAPSGRTASGQGAFVHLYEGFGKVQSRSMHLDFKRLADGLPASEMGRTSLLLSNAVRTSADLETRRQAAHQARHHDGRVDARGPGR